MSVALTMGRTSNCRLRESEGQKSGAQHCGQRPHYRYISTRLIHYFNDDWSMNAGVAGSRLTARCVVFPVKYSTIRRYLSFDEGFHRCRTFSRPEHTAGLNGHIDTGSIGHDLSLLPRDMSGRFIVPKEQVPAIAGYNKYVSPGCDR